MVVAGLVWWDCENKFFVKLLLILKVASDEFRY